MKEKVLIIEDDINTLHGLGEILEDENFNISKAKNAKQALKEIENGDFDVVLMDYLLPDRDGLDLSREVLKDYPEIKIIMIPGSESRDM